MRKKLFIMILIFIFSSQTAFASILGSLVDMWNIQIAHDTALHKTVFHSNQSGVGLQTEYFAEYTPNELVRPVVVTGESIWGSRTIMQAVQYMNQNHMRPMLGVNASFFSLQTGIPMGHVITNGEITSKDTTNLAAVGFRKDGTAFMGELGIYSTVTFGDYILEIQHINKFLQKDTQVLNLYTDAFGQNTNATADTINIILGSPDSKLSIGGTTTAVVEDIIYQPGGVDIPDGKMVLSLNMDGNQWTLTLLKTIEIGQKVTIKNEATSEPELWAQAYNGLASEGKRLIKNGQIQSGFEAGAAPRTAVGITGTGSVIFYVLDGRQSGYSYGAKQETLAKRMQELGCVDALNLDGGGSTTIAGVYPGSGAVSVMNSPSDGSPRKVSNFIFLQSFQEETGKLGMLQMEPYSTHMLVDNSIQVSTHAVDTGFYPMEVPDVSYSVETDNATITQSGLLSVTDAGPVVVRADGGGKTATTTYHAYDTITDIGVVDKSTGKRVDEIVLPAGSVVDLTADAYVNGLKLLSTPSQFSWHIEETEIATIEDGVLTLTEVGGVATLVVAVAGFEKRIPIKSTDGTSERYPFSEVTIQDDKLTIELFSTGEEIVPDFCVIKIDGEEIQDSAKVVQTEDLHYILEYQKDAEFLNAHRKITVISVVANGNTTFETWSFKSDVLQEVEFLDTKTHWARDMVSYMSDAGVVHGYKEEDGVYFRPDNSMTRAEFAVMMAGFVGVTKVDDANPDVFADSDQIPAWAHASVCAMYEMGIIRGSDEFGKLYFHPQNPITRAEMMAIIARILPEGLKRAELEFLDQEQIPLWAADAVAQLVQAGLANGYEDNTIRPDRHVTRAEAVVLLYNVY